MPNPRLRFKKADGTDYPDWEKKKLGELTYKTGVKNKNNLDLETYSINNIDGFVPQKEQFENAGYLKNADRSIYYIVSHGSFAYNPARINVGSIGFQNLRKDVLVSSLYEIFNTKDELNDKFLMNYFQTINFKNNVKKYSEGGVRSYFYYDKLCSLNVFIPCLEEQNKIADFLSDIDEFISLSDQEVKKLQELKKGAMQKIFSQEIRFKKDDGTDYPDWEEKCFNDVFDCFEYGLNASATKYDGKNKYIRITDIDEEARTYSYNDVVSPNCELEDKYLVKENDILFARTGASVGKTYLYQKSDGILYFAGFLIRGHVNSKFDSRFIFQSTLSEEFKIWIKVNSVRTGQPGINSQQYASYKLQIPCLEEQEKIGDFLSDFDEAISLAKQELEKWKLLKKGLLQQMFV